MSVTRDSFLISVTPIVTLRLGECMCVKNEIFQKLQNKNPEKFKSLSRTVPGHAHDCLNYVCDQEFSYPICGSVAR